MSKVFVTGSADGLGRMAARQLVQDDHQVLVHGRDEARAEEALAGVPGAIGAVAGDLASLAGTSDLAAAVNEHGAFDAVLHNAAVGPQEPRRVLTEDGLARVFQVNALAPYLLSVLIERPRRLVYTSSGLHRSASASSLEDPQWERRRWDGVRAYSESKLFDVVLAFGLSRRWPEVSVNAAEPGWVATKMGGAGAPDDLDQGATSQVWLAVDPEAAGLTGAYLYHLAPAASNPAASDEGLQERFFDYCARLTGTPLP